MNDKATKGSFVSPPEPLAPRMRIGLLGGSFNPAHQGHIHASTLALKQLHLDRIWWLVSPQNPLKPASGMAEFESRLKAAKAFARHPRIAVTGIEAELGTRFTIDTLRLLRRRFPHIHFVWLMGSDNLIQIPRWRRWREIFRLVPVAVVTRPGTALAARNAKPATIFRNYAAPADAGFATSRPPALTILDAKGNPSSATLLRASRS